MDDNTTVLRNTFNEAEQWTEWECQSCKSTFLFDYGCSSYVYYCPCCGRKIRNYRTISAEVGVENG